jgi:acyl transferase domain-containing protein
MALLITVAGIPMDRAVGSDTSVYVGAFTRDYEALMGKDPELANLYRATGVGTSMLANRMSWFYNFSGPSMVLDTACSSSLTALHIACQSLRSRESSMVSLRSFCDALKPSLQVEGTRLWM